MRQVAFGQRPEHRQVGGSKGISVEAEEVARLWGERVRGGSDGNKDSRVDEEGVGKEAGRVKGGGAGERKGEGARKEGARKETQ